MTSSVDDAFPAVGSGSLRVLLRHSAGYGIGVLAIRAAPLLLVPALTRQLSPEQFGLFDLDTTLVTVLAVLAGLGLDGAAFRLYYDAPDENRRRNVLATAVLMQLAAGAAIAGLLTLTATVWADPITGHRGQAGDVMLAVAAIPAMVALTSITVYLRVQARVTAFNIVAGAQTVLTIAAVISALALGPRSEGTVLLAVTVAATLAAGVALIAGRDLLRGRFELAAARRLIGYGLPLVPATLAVWALPLVGRLVVSHLRGANDLALLGLGIKVAAVLGLFVAAFQMAWGAFSLTVATRPDAPRIYARVLQAVLLAVSAGAVVLAVLARPALVLAGTPAYAEAAPLVGWLLLGGVCAAAFQVTNVGAVVSRRSDLTAAATLTALALCIVISIPLVAVLGVEGAALGAAVALAVGAWMPVVMTRRLFPQEFSLGPVIPLLAAGIGVVALGGRPGVTGPVTALGLGTLAAAYVAATLLVGRRLGLLPRRRMSGRQIEAPQGVVGTG